VTYYTRDDFFKIGTTYLGKYGWKFRVHEITTDPRDGMRVAHGERFWEGRWEPYSYWQEDWEMHQAIGYYIGTEAS
jgi:hypothetical protein